MLESDGDHTRTRREVLAAGASLAGFSMLGGVARAGGAATRSGEDLLDEGYARIAARFPDANVHASNHAPMVAEVLAVLGHAEAIGPWLDENLDGARPGSAARERIDADAWRAALGRTERYADWQACFRSAIAETGWRATLGLWVPRLATGLGGAATHGLIRTAHAARALGRRENAVRETELSIGLAYWAATHQELPWDGSLAPEPSVERALAKVSARRPQVAPPEGNIVTGLRALDETPSFRAVAGYADTSEPLRMLSESASVFARVYLANPDRRIAFVHSITAPSALRLLAPHLDAETLRVGARYAWQAAAGLWVVYADPGRAAPAPRAAASSAALVARAVESGATHALKLLEACLREHELSRDHTLLLAAEDAIGAVRM
jgi:hypothetical protein